jgi:hypothetical protein
VGLASSHQADLCPHHGRWLPLHEVNNVVRLKARNDITWFYIAAISFHKTMYFFYFASKLFGFWEFTKPHSYNEIKPNWLNLLCIKVGGFAALTNLQCFVQFLDQNQKKSKYCD